MFGSSRRRRRERDEFLMMHSKIAAIHGDLLRRDEELITALATLTAATHHVEERLQSDTTLAGVLSELVAGRESPALDLTRERVLGGSVDAGVGERTI